MSCDVDEVTESLVSRMGGSSGDVSEEHVTQEKRKKGLEYEL